MSEELKACPFCGVDSDWENYVTEHSVDCFFVQIRDERYKKSLSAWNIRPIEDTLRKQLDVAIHALKDLYEGADFYMLNNEAQAWVANALAEIEKIGGANVSER